MRPPLPSLTRRHGVVTGVALLHLLWVACGALQVPLFTGTGRLASWAQVYTHWTGAGSRFSFFAPGVSPAVRVSFDVEQSSGEHVRDQFKFENSAVNVRIHSMLLRFGLKEGRDALARAWAAAMFGRHPDARAVTVRVEALRLPTMEAYREGARPEWSDAYRAGFEHRAPTAATTGAVTP
ncbi:MULTISPECIES: hypothetical protein [Corallococcus]|uniref:hypothetical protein n=1 Tax=Corallococcus TaxID=83461 RepID=UPI001180FEF8|nr:MULTISPECIES: hypothetical protein [Corallococcus]NBD07731.1 hypothetical protein [Corallococcus silvisoli]TSC33725.1 hypothetical protein FOF48_01340 [Corallococcus sp. Z5C101001]